MESSPFNRSGLTRRTPPPPTPPQAPPAPEEEDLRYVTTGGIQDWLMVIERYLNEVCSISTEGKLNSDQKLKISNLCRKIGHGSSHMAVLYQSLKQKTMAAYSKIEVLEEERDLVSKITADVKQAINESCPKPAHNNSSFADMVKKGSNNFVRPTQLSSVAIYPNDEQKSSEETRELVKKIISPGEIKLQVRGVRKTTKGGVIISTESKDDIQKLRTTVQQSSSGLRVDEPQKRNPRIVVMGVPSSLPDSEVFSYIYEQNLAEKLSAMTKESFLTSIKLSHKSGRRDAETCNYILEVSPSIRKALIIQDRVFINWSSCPIRDFTLVTRCFKCQQYGHASKTCKETVSVCGHCGENGHKMVDCTKKSELPKCATCIRYKKPSDHKTGDPDCPAKKNAEFRYINSVNYESA